VILPVIDQTTQQIGPSQDGLSPESSHRRQRGYRRRFQNDARRA
jgi:hypothetical protein